MDEPLGQPRNWKRVLLLAASTLIILGVVFAFVPVGPTLAAIGRLRLSTIVLVLAISTVFNALVFSDRWRRALAHVGVQVSLREVVRVEVGTGPIRLLFPIQAGELITAAALARRSRSPTGKVVSTLLYNKFLTLLATFLLLTLGVLCGGSSQGFIMRAVAVAGFAVVGVFFLLEIRPVRTALVRLAGRLGKKSGETAVALFAAFDELPARAKFNLLLYSVFFQFSEVVACFFLFRDLGIHLPFGQLVVFVQLIILASSLPVSIAGFGTREGAALILLAPLATPEAAVAAGIVYSFFEYLWPMIMGLPITSSVSMEALGKGG